MINNSNIFQQKLAQHELPIDDSFWAEMETRLDASRRAKVIPMWRWFGAMAASLALLIGLSLFFNSNENILPIADSRDAARSISTTETIIAKNRQDNLTENISAKNNTVIKTVSECTWTVSTSDIVNPSSADTIISEKTEIAENQKTETKPKTEKIIELKPKTDEPNFKPQTSNFKRTSISIAANFSSGGNAANRSQNSSEFAQNPIKGISRAPAYAAADEITLEQVLQDYPEENHLPPLSVGISVRKNFNRRFALETGITYTYLQSEFRNDYTWDENWVHDRAILTQHYIGIPLNAVVNITGNRKWNAYFSLGAMAEKGVWFKYDRTRTYSYSTEIYNQNLDGKIDGFQFSATAAAGLEYRFAGAFSLYFEPKFNYYFDCNQPRSFRTESPFNIGANGGIRVSF